MLRAGNPQLLADIEHRRRQVVPGHYRPRRNTMVIANAVQGIPSANDVGDARTTDSSLFRGRGRRWCDLRFWAGHLWAWNHNFGLSGRRCRRRRPCKRNTHPLPHMKQVRVGDAIVAGDDSVIDAISFADTRQCLTSLHYMNNLGGLGLYRIQWQPEEQERPNSNTGDTKSEVLPKICGHGPRA